MRQLDVAADRQAARLVGAAVGRLHDARPAAGDDREAGLRQLGADPPGQLVAAGRPRGVRAEPKTVTAGPTLGQGLEALDELGQDPQRAPRVRLEERRALGGGR